MDLQKLYENPDFGIYLIIIIGVLLVLFFVFLILALKDAKKNKKAMENNQPVAEINPGIDNQPSNIETNINSEIPNTEVAFNSETPMYQMDVPTTQPTGFDMGMSTPVEPVTFNPVASPVQPVTEIPPVTNDFRINNDYNEVATPVVEPVLPVEPVQDFRINVEPVQEINPVQEQPVEEPKSVFEDQKPVLEPITSPEIKFHTSNETPQEVKLEQTSIFDQPISFENDIEPKEDNINELNKLIDERMNTIEKISNEDNNISKNHQFSSVFVDAPKPTEEAPTNPMPKVNFNDLEPQEPKVVELPKVRDIPSPKSVEPVAAAANLDDLVNNAFK